MATAQVLSEVDDLLTCSICLELLTNPHTLQQCFHSYCKECAETKIERKYDSGRLGVYCPVCRTFSSNDEIKANFFVSDMLEKHAKLQSQIKPQCKQCSSKEATQRCVECKMYLCDPCKAMHLSIPLLQNHEVLPFDGTEDMVIDKLMFCPHHNGKAIEFNCKKCETLLCIMCKIIGHESHQTETIETALQRLLPQMKQNTNKLDENLERLEEQIQEIDGKMTDIKTKYESCFCVIKESADLAISLIKHEQNRLEQKVEDKLLSEQKKLQSIRDDLQMKKDAGSNFSKLVDNCLQKARHTSQLAEIQGGLFSKVEENSKPIDPIKQLDITIPNYKISTDFTTLSQQEEFLGRIKYTKRNVFSENLPAEINQTETFEQYSENVRCEDSQKCPDNVVYMTNDWVSTNQQNSYSYISQKEPIATERIQNKKVSESNQGISTGRSNFQRTGRAVPVTISQEGPIPTERIQNKKVPEIDGNMTNEWISTGRSNSHSTGKSNSYSTGKSNSYSTGKSNSHSTGVSVPIQNKKSHKKKWKDDE